MASEVNSPPRELSCFEICARDGERVDSDEALMGFCSLLGKKATALPASERTAMEATESFMAGSMGEGTLRRRVDGGVMDEQWSCDG